MRTHQPGVKALERQSTAGTQHPVSGPEGRLQDLRATGWLLVIRCSRLKPDMAAGEREGYSTHTCQQGYNQRLGWMKRREQTRGETTQVNILNSIKDKMWNQRAAHQDLLGIPTVNAEFEGHWLTGMRNMDTHLEKHKTVVMDTSLRKR